VQIPTHTVGETFGRPRAFTERPYEVVVEFRVCVEHCVENKIFLSSDFFHKNASFF
jgi:hypothetical protein